ncbi:MAG: hypothetical protein QG646_944 [Euryarchaeota archaeon]|nr:hypothetical protein [Euryarchaeota archaeon]
MDSSVVTVNLSSIIGSNFPIIIGIFVTLSVMGIATFYDKRKGENKIQVKIGNERPSSNLIQKIQDFSSKYTSNFSEYSKKLSSLIPERMKKHSPESSEIKPLKSTGGIPKIFGTVKSKISSFSFSMRGKKNKFGNENSALQPNKKAKTSKFNENEKISSFDIDRVVDSKKDELDFDDNVLSEMSTASSLKNKNAALMNADLEFDKNDFDKNDFDIGFEELNDESPEENALFDSGAEKIALGDDTDSLLDSLKKDIIIKKEKKIDFMTSMQGEDLEIKSLKSDLEGTLKRLKQFKQYSKN